MATRIIRNDFVAGELSPEIHGRHDTDVYFHGAASIRNFVARRTGGLRKRAGTELLWHVRGGSAARSYKIVPYLYDKDTFGALALWREDGSSTLHYSIYCHTADGTVRTKLDQSTSAVSLSAAEDITKIRYKQIGDTLFFTLRGHRAFKALITITTSSVTAEGESIPDTIKVANPPALKLVKAYFPHNEKDKGYVKGTRSYQLWGVKDGVYSKPTELTVDIYLAWVAGEYVDLKFTPNWSKHDKYVLGKLCGAQYGEITSFYPDTSAGTYEDATHSMARSSQTGNVDGVAYTAASANPASAWKTTNPDTKNAAGLHTTGTFAGAFTSTYKTPSAPVLAWKFYFGAKMKDSSEAVREVGSGEPVVVRIRRENASGAVLAKWTVTPQYSDNPQRLLVEDPVAAASYYIEFLNEDETAAVSVPMRGVALCSDTGTCTFHDDNIAAGLVCGAQDLLTVGDTGMDVDIVDVWEQRLLLASSQKLPFTLWFSKTGDLYNFYAGRPQVADDAFEATLAATRASRILHVVSEKWLLLFTESGTYIVSSSSGAFAHNTISFKKITAIGAHAGIPPVTTESDVLFVAQDGRSVYQMDYSLEKDSVVPTCVSHRASHVTEEARIVDVAYQCHPDSVVWCLLSDGTMAALTFMQSENVMAWTRHAFAGGAGLKLVDVVEAGSIRSEAGTDTTSDILLVWTHKDAPGDVWIERMRPCVVSDRMAEEKAVCKDHMGYAKTDWPPGGNPEAPVEASVVTMKLEPQQEDQMGRQANVYGTCLRLKRSGRVAVRPAESGVEWQSSAFQDDCVPRKTKDGIELVSRDVKLQARAFNNPDARLEIRSDDEYPCNILSLGATVAYGNIRGG